MAPCRVCSVCFPTAGACKPERSDPVQGTAREGRSLLLLPGKGRLRDLRGPSQGDPPAYRLPCTKWAKTYKLFLWCLFFFFQKLLHQTETHLQRYAGGKALPPYCVDRLYVRQCFKENLINLSVHQDRQIIWILELWILFLLVFYDIQQKPENLYVFFAGFWHQKFKSCLEWKTVMEKVKKLGKLKGILTWIILSKFCVLFVFIGSLND